ncbi:MAG: hypothetical protein CME70_19535 [Halobacteriovorax sp.]|nr:hypothetical protein [Halobacteriovorax sp.]MBK26200.1 hypothetical protein [Halobacteriovorax sp.]|tara:strand:- start:686 stop:892 length:207 start_codon:yes stop_codon:yes gene_type:complete
MKHLRENNETYISHLIFAGKVAIHLGLSSIFLILHGILPFWSPPESFNLDSMCKKIQGWNDYSHRRKE